MFDQIKYFLFDLDNTLYHPGRGPLVEVDRRMNRYIMEKFNKSVYEAVNLRKKYYYAYGTTLGGLMEHHHIDPYDFLDYVHDVEDQYLPPPNKGLFELLNGLKKPIYVVTNSYFPYANKVLDRLGISSLIEEVYDISFMDLKNKSHESSYVKVLSRIDPKADNGSFVMFDDVWKYLESAYRLKIKTVLVNPRYEGTPHFHIESIGDLGLLLG